MNSAETPKRRLMYIEKKDGDIDGAAGRIGWVTVSNGGAKVYYRGRTLTRVAGRAEPRPLLDEGTGHEYWVTPVKKTGTHAHFSPRVPVRIDPDARYEYRRVRTDDARSAVEGRKTKPSTPDALSAPPATSRWPSGDSAIPSDWPPVAQPPDKKKSPSPTRDQDFTVPLQSFDSRRSRPPRSRG